MRGRVVWLLWRAVAWRLKPFRLAHAERWGVVQIPHSDISCWDSTFLGQRRGFEIRTWCCRHTSSNQQSAEYHYIDLYLSEWRCTTMTVMTATKRVDQVVSRVSDTNGDLRGWRVGRYMKLESWGCPSLSYAFVARGHGQCVVAGHIHIFCFCLAIIFVKINCRGGVRRN